MKRDGVSVVLKLLGVGVRQPGKTTHPIPIVRLLRSRWGVLTCSTAGSPVILSYERRCSRPGCNAL
jgi:hypothetical protein